MELVMPKLTLLSAVGPVTMDAVAFLPKPLRQLGSAMLGWIGRRARLPGVSESVMRQCGERMRPGRAATAVARPGAAGADADDLYRRWCHATDAAERRRHLGELTHAFTPLIRSTIRQYAVVQMAGNADLEQEAFLGLHEALQRFDPRRGVALAGFVRWRIIGAILDARRRWMRECRGYWQDAVGQTHRAMGAVRDGGAGSAGGDDVEFEDLFAVLSRGLSAREAFIVRLAVLEEKTCRQIGALLGLHHGRVGQIYRQAIETLRANPRVRRLLAGAS